MHFNKCDRGVIPVSMVNCKTTVENMSGYKMTYMEYQEQEVETYGKGKPYKRFEKVGTELAFNDFVERYR